MLLACAHRREKQTVGSLYVCTSSYMKLLRRVLSSWLGSWSSLVLVVDWQQALSFFSFAVPTQFPSSQWDKAHAQLAPTSTSATCRAATNSSSTYRCAAHACICMNVHDMRIHSSFHSHIKDKYTLLKKAAEQRTFRSSATNWPAPLSLLSPLLSTDDASSIAIPKHRRNPVKDQMFRGNK